MRAAKLKRKRQEFEEQNKDAIEAQQRRAEARRRREASISDQRELLAHILKHHSSLYELLQVRPGSVARGPSYRRAQA